MSELERAAGDLVVANRILANEGVVDAYGHVSIRHPLDPKRYLLSRSRSPELVERGDIMEFGLDGAPTGDDGRSPYLERFIHGAIYEARPDVHAVVHSHAGDVLPFSITTTRLRPVVHTASCIGERIPLWDIRDKFGDTKLLVTNMAHGRDLAGCLGSNGVVLMRGHGFAAAGRSLLEAVRIAVYMPRNARIFMQARQLGRVKALSRGEIEIRATTRPDAPEMWRAWEYWAVRAGCGDMLPKRSPAR